MIKNLKQFQSSQKNPQNTYTYYWKYIEEINYGYFSYFKRPENILYHQDHSEVKYFHFKL